MYKEIRVSIDTRSEMIDIAGGDRQKTPTNDEKREPRKQHKIITKKKRESVRKEK